MLLILNVIYVLVAIAMIALILLQRGAGAQAGSGFGAGASATVFGSRGASNFLSKSTKWLAVVFFGISLFMAWYATHGGQPKAPSEQDLGVMSQTATPKPEQKLPVVPTAPAAQPIPQAAPPAATQPASSTTVPAAPASEAPAPAATPEKPASQGG